MPLIKNCEEINIGETGKFLVALLPEIFNDLSPENSFDGFGKEISELSESHSLIFIVGFGKASYSMYSGIRKFIKKSPTIAEIIIPEDMEIENRFDELKIMRGTHPVTGIESETATATIIEDLKGLKETDLVFALISGGGSALFEKPKSGFSIEDISHIGSCMMLAGADIRELNTIRGILSTVKAGKFAGFLYPAAVKAYIISDVIGDDIGVIASGPLSPVSQDKQFTIDTIYKYSKTCGYTVEDLLSVVNDAPAKKYFDKVSNTIILRNHDFVMAISKRIEKRGDVPVILGSDISGDVVSVSKHIADICRMLYTLKRHGFWLIFGGETTVHVKGKGLGGRSQELAIRFAMEMKPGERYTVMAIGTDGIDGKSPAMGGIIDEKSMSELKQMGVEAYLDNNDAFTILSKNRSALITGFTGTNVSDIVVVHYGMS